MTHPLVHNIGLNLERIHRVISRGLDVAINNTQRASTDGEGAPHEGYLNYVHALTTVLDGHHVVEDEIVFPFFQDRIPEAPYEHLRMQHQEMLGNIGVANEALARIRSGIGIHGASEQLSEALRRLEATWSFHIETEESHLTAKRVDQAATVEEQRALLQRIGQFNQEHLQPGPICVPFVLYNLDVEDRAIMASMMPPQVTQELVPGPWKEQWASMRPFLLE